MENEGSETESNEIDSGTTAGEAAELAELQAELDDSSQEGETSDDSGSEETTETTGTDTTKTETAETSEGDDDGTATETAENVDTETEVDTDNNSDSSQEKPPKGFVPYQAVKEVRQKNSVLQSERDALMLRVEELSKKPATEEGSEDAEPFKVLSEDEFDDLLEDDPDEAARYQHKLFTHKEKEAESAKAEAYFKEAENYNRGVIDSAQSEIESLIVSKEIAIEVRDAGVAAGLNQETIGFLTNPTTKFTVTGDKGEQTYLLGQGAVQMVNVLKAIADNNPEKLRSEIRAELIPEITKQITDKIKNPNATVSLDEGLSTSGDMGGKSFADYSEAEWNALPEEQRMKALQG